MKRDIKSVDEYIAAQPDTAQPALTRVRETIRKAVPKAEETISYRIPAYKLNGDRMLFFAGWKRHYSVYPATKRLIASLKDDLRDHEVIKSTVRFSLDKPVPVKLIAKIAKLRAGEATGAKKN